MGDKGCSEGILRVRGVFTQLWQSSQSLRRSLILTWAAAGAGAARQDGDVILSIGNSVKQRADVSGTAEKPVETNMTGRQRPNQAAQPGRLKKNVEFFKKRDETPMKNRELSCPTPVLSFYHYPHFVPPQETGRPRGIIPHKERLASCHNSFIL
jgi:hypothetical protein